MIQPEEELIRFLFAIMVLSILVPLAEATTMNLTVPKGEEVSKSIRLAVEDRVLIEFTVVGQTSSTLDFYITGPHGSVKVEYHKTSNVDYCFL